MEQLPSKTRGRISYAIYCSFVNSLQYLCSLLWTLLLMKSECGPKMLILIIIYNSGFYWMKEYIKENASSVFFMVYGTGLGFE